MKTFTSMKWLCLLMVIGFARPADAQVIFSEDFSNGIPGTWTLIDNDGLVPNANVAQFTAAWIGAADPDNVTDTVAMSTSWYDPAPGTSDDWLITPQIALTTNNILAWEAEAQDAGYPDGYEVRISTTTPTIAGFNANPALFSIAAENGAVWTPRTVDLGAAGYSNQSVYIAWRNTSTDQFILMVDDVSVTASAAFDAEMTVSSAIEYTQVPLPQVTNLITDGVISNLGTSTVTNVEMKVNVYDGTMTNIYTATSTTLATLSSGNNSSFSVTGFSPSAGDIYTVEYVALITEADGNGANDTVSIVTVVNDSVYARDENIVAGTLGIGAGNGGDLGQLYTLDVPDTLTSVSMFIANNNGDLAGQPLFARIWDVSGGFPTTLLGTTDTLIFDTTQNQLYTLMVNGGPMFLNLDSFAVTVAETDSNITLGNSVNIFTNNTTFIDWPTNPLNGWAHSEAFGTQFALTFVLRANFGKTPPPPASCTLDITGFSTTDATCNGDTDGSATVTFSGQQGTASILWSSGGTSATETNLGAGVYTVIISDTAACASDTMITIAEPAAMSLSAAVDADVTCNGGTDGQATANVTSGNQGAVTYSWSSGGTSATETGLAAGTYTVTATDANGCTVMQTVTITEPTAVAISITGTDETIVGQNDGSADATVSGGTPPYTYLWAPGGETTEDISGLAPGTYTLTATDANGCTFDMDVTIAAGSPNGIADNENVLSMRAYPNPVADMLTLDVEVINSTKASILVTNQLGQLIFQSDETLTGENKLMIDTRNWAKGLYQLTVVTPDGMNVLTIVR